MMDTDRLRPRLSPLDWYKLGSSVLFVGLGGFILVRALLTLGRRGSITQIVLGGLIFLYGLYRIWAAIRNLRRLQREAREEQDADRENA